MSDHATVSRPSDPDVGKPQQDSSRNPHIPPPASLPAAILLAIDTCGPAGSLALGRIEPGRESSINILAVAELAGKTYSAQLIPRVEEIFRQLGMTLSDVSALIVVNGPGSFTGIRIGMSAAKGLAEGAELPIIAVSRLELLARQAPANTCAALDAGRGEFYFGLYRDGKLETEALCTLVELLEAVSNSNLGIVVCEEKPALQLRDRFAPNKLVAAPTAVEALMACVERYEAGDFADIVTLDGNYLRRPDAENTANQITLAAGL